MLNKELINRFFSYIVLSGIAFLVNFGSRFGYDYILKSFVVPDLLNLNPKNIFNAGVTLAYVTGMLVNFATSKWITFKAADSGRGKREAIKFFVIALIGLVVNVVVSEYTLYYIQQWPALSLPIDSIQLIEGFAHLAGIGVGLIFNFAGHQLLSFQNTGLWDRLTGNKAARSEEK